MHRQSVIYVVIAIVAVILIVGLVATRNTHRPATTAPGVAPAPQTGAIGSPSNTVEPCVQTQADARSSTTNTATTTEGTTPDGRPTGAFVGSPCAAANGTVGTSGTQGTVGTGGSGTTSWRPGGTSGSGVTHGAQQGR